VTSTKEEMEARLAALEARQRALEFAVGLAVTATCAVSDPGELALALRATALAPVVGKHAAADEHALAVQTLLERWAAVAERI
jgi:hypothetical protein